MKKYRILSVFLSTFLATQICTAVESYCINIGEPSPPTSSTKPLYTSKGDIVLHPFDVVKVIKEDETYLMFADITQGRIFEFDSLPSDEEAVKIIGPVASACVFITADTPYIMNYSITKDGVVTKTETDYFAVIKYVIDTTKKEIRSYESDDVLHSLDDKASYYIGPFGENPAQYKPILYLGGDMFITPSTNGGATHDSLFNSDQNTKPQSIEYGDINADSEIDLSDLTMLSLHLLGDKNLTEEKLKYADCNGDGTVNLADLAHFKQYISKDNVTLGPVS